jgi:hypothetical protein
MYFSGPQQAPVNNEANVQQLADLIKAALPSQAPGGPMVWLSTTTPETSCSKYFSTPRACHPREDSPAMKVGIGRMAITPEAQPIRRAGYETRIAPATGVIHRMICYSRGSRICF